MSDTDLQKSESSKTASDPGSTANGGDLQDGLKDPLAKKEMVDPLGTPSSNEASAEFPLDTSVAGKKYKVVTDRVNVREGPQSRKRQLGQLSSGEQFTALGIHQGWLAIDYMGAKGFVPSFNGKKKFVLPVDEAKNPEEKESSQGPKLEFDYSRLFDDLVWGALKKDTPVEPYISQRSNKSQTGKKEEGQWDASNTCGQTSLAMLLLSEIPTDKLMNAVASLVAKENGGEPNGAALLQRFKNNPNTLSESIVLLYKAQVGSSEELLRIARRIIAESGVNLEAKRVSTGKADIFETLKEYDGTRAVLGTRLTGAGHFVVLERVLSDGIVVNDPWGLVMTIGQKPGKKYAKNGDSSLLLRKLLLTSEGVSALQIRTRESGRAAELTQAAQAAKLPNDMGRRVFFGADELKPMDIGITITSVSKKKA